jgi:ribosome-associated toxin RatA of RatAB toxin-antitoxin module
MREVTLFARLPEGDPADVFERLIAFERYPEMVDPIRAVEVDQVSPTVINSRWSVFFRKGILNWAERDYLDRDNLTITFEQTDGDFDVLSGSWQVEPTEDGCDIRFQIKFDFGVTSIESIIEPIAARVLKENMELVLIGLLGSNVHFPPVEEGADEAVHTRYAVFDLDEPPDIPGLAAGKHKLAAGNSRPASS